MVSSLTLEATHRIEYCGVCKDWTEQKREGDIWVCLNCETIQSPKGEKGEER